MSSAGIAPASVAPSEELMLAQRISTGDRAAFETLMRRHNRRLYRIARAALKNDAEAEDALQDAYLIAYRSLPRFRGEATLATWLSRIVLNECLGRLRRAARRQRILHIVSTPETDASNRVAAAADEHPENSLGRSQLRSLLERHLDDLPEEFRIVFVLRSVEELSVEETAQTLGIPNATVRSRYFRAKSLLRDALTQELDFAERDMFDFAGTRCDRVVTAVLGRLPGPAP